jgi:menaquinone-9 beta-reductase
MSLSFAMESRLNPLALESIVRPGQQTCSKRALDRALEWAGCHSSLSVSDAASIDWDAAVIGAGPTGALAARQLALSGLKTLLIDRSTFPRAKVCGGCISGLGREVLRSVGLERLLEPPVAAPLDRFALAAAGRCVSFSLPPGAAVSRLHFDVELIREAVCAGAAVLEGTTTTVRGLSDGCRFRRMLLQFEGGSVLARARIVIVADGLGRTSLKDHQVFAPRVASASRMGLGATLPGSASDLAPGGVLMSVARDGYVGLVQVPGNVLNLAAAVDPNSIRQRGTAAVVREILIRAGAQPPEGLDTAQWHGTGLLTRHSRRLSARRLLVLGDAAGYVEPFTGEGMTWGMLSAVLAAPLVQNWLSREGAGNDEGVVPSRGFESLSRAWRTIHRAQIAHRQRDCRILACLLRRSMAVDVAMKLMSVAPRIARPIIRHFWNSGSRIEATVRAIEEKLPRSALPRREGL